MDQRILEMGMIRRDIHPQWHNIMDWYWRQYQEGQTNPTIWQVLEREYGARRIRSMGQKGWSVVEFPDEKSYNWFLLRWL